MNKQVELLRLYNQWRRGDIEHLDSTAQEISESIDEVTEQHGELLTALKVIAVWAQNPEADAVSLLKLIHDKSMEAIAKAKREQG